MDPGAIPVRRRFLWTLLVGLALLIPAPVQADWDGESIKITDALKDGTGIVWGIDGTGHDLYVLDANLRWKLATPPGIGSEMKPFCLGRRYTDGAVFCLWQTNDINCQCSLHQGKLSKVFEPFYLSQQAQIRPTRLTGDSKGNMWVTRASPIIYHLEADGDAQSVRTVTRSECLPGTVKGYATYDPWEPVSMFEDAGGRLWFWTMHPSGSTTFGGVIRGALLYEGPQLVRSDLFVQRDMLEPTLQSQKGITVLAQKDAQHLWFGLNGDGLHTLDTSTNQTERVPGQPGDSFYTSLIAKSASGDWLFVMANGRTLWRLTSDGRWNRVIDNLDLRYDSHGQQDRMWAQDEQGDYVGSNGKGVWFIPRDGSPPRLLGWEQGFPLATPRRFIDLSDGRWLGIGTNGQTWVGSPSTLPQGGSPAGQKVRTMDVKTEFRADAHGHLWSTFVEEATVLHEWDGDRWIEHPIPDEFSVGCDVNIFNLDLRGRTWLNSTGGHTRCAVYDPAEDHWQVFENFRKAAEAQGGKHDAETVPAEHIYNLVRFGPEGRICFFDDFAVAYFDGQQWHKWDQSQIEGPQAGSYDGPPFFDHAGHVSININHHTREYVDGSGWRATDYEPGFAEWATFLDYPAQKLPDFQLPFRPEQSALDNQGAWWLLHERTLYKARDGLCVAILRATDAQPFADGRKLGWAFVDPRGHAFLRADNRLVKGPTVTLASPGPLPHTVLSSNSTVGKNGVSDPSGRIMIRLTTDAKPIDGKTRFIWRLDDGPWTPLAVDGSASDLTLEGLPGGPHQVEARSFDPALQTDVAPAVYAFEVRVDPQAQIAGFIAQLDDPDYSKRNAAVAALVRQPDLALPALKRARSQADENHRWWLDAAIQQVERHRK